MFPLNMALAVASISAPVEVSVPHHLNTLSMRHTMAQVAVAFEILDPNECRYVFVRDEDYACDLKLIRRRYAELKDAPPACDAVRFPNRDLVTELLSFNRMYRAHLERARQLYPPSHPDADWFAKAIAETDLLYQIWDTARDARCGYYYITVRRQALAKLRDQIGPQNYYAGCLPPHVPVWRMRRID